VFGIGFFKGQPTEYIIEYVGAGIRREGAGLAFCYLPHKTNIVAVPTSSTDADFVFHEVTNDFQEVTIQGQFTYRVRDPHQAASLLNFTLNPRVRAYVSNEPDRVPLRVSNVIQMHTRDEIRSRSLESALAESQAIAALVLQRAQEQAATQPTGMMGVELLNLYFLSIRPTPEVAKALEADYRESLLRKADEAIYARRAAAVEKERKIKENALNTEIALEQQRQQLIDLEGANVEREAEYRGKALERETAFRAKAMEMEADVYREVEPLKILAMAVRELSANVDRALGALRKLRPEAPGGG
jgi:hypothetical protein